MNETFSKIIAWFKKWFYYLFDKYEWLLSFLLKIKDVKVNKEKFTRAVVKHFYKKQDRDAMFQKAMETSLCDVLSPEQQRKYYKRMMWQYGSAVFLTSFFLTFVPDIVWVTILSCVVDLVIFQCLLFIAMQKTLILYGEECDLSKAEEQGVERLIAIDSSGLMIGKYPLLQKMKSVLGWLGKQVVRRIGPRLIQKFSRTGLVIVRRQAIKWFSIVLAKEHVNVMFDMIIPFTCAIISGVVSAIIFVPMCNKLRKHIILQHHHSDQP